MKILFAAAEVAPIAKIGGMGDVVGALPKVLKKLGHDVRIIMPYYGFLPDKMEIPEHPVWSGNAMAQNFTIHETRLPGTDVPLYLVGHVSFAPRRIYFGEDEHWRFTLFANAAAEFVWNYWKPNILHCHDWHTGMLPVWMRETPDVGTVFTIHNLAYQGPGRGFLEHTTWCPWYMEGDNSMAAGIMAADRVNSVSPTYSKQIQTPECGERLDGLLARVSGKLKGILNGIDIESYNPATDKHIYQNYSVDTLEKRRANKIKLQEEVGLEINSNVFLLGMVTRLVEQKGLDLVVQVLDRLLNNSDAQLLVLGVGDRHYETQLWELSTRFRGRISVQLIQNDPLARRIYSGTDAFLMPSRFEPCGISQMLAMRYGCIPIVRRTGGLLDTVSFHDPIHEAGTGYCFDRYDALDLFICLIRAWEGFRYKPQWQNLQRRGMLQDFSWYKSALEYTQLYRDIIREKPEITEEDSVKPMMLAS